MSDDHGSHDTTVTRDADRSRFEITVGGTPAGFAAYELSEGRIEFTHTEISDEFEGEGIGGTLVRTALDTARTDGLEVVPTCPFVKRYIERHDEYADLLAAGR